MSETPWGDRASALEIVGADGRVLSVEPRDDVLTPGPRHGRKRKGRGPEVPAPAGTWRIPHRAEIAMERTPPRTIMGAAYEGLGLGPRRASLWIRIDVADARDVTVGEDAVRVTTDAGITYELPRATLSGRAQEFHAD